MTYMFCEYLTLESSTLISNEMGAGKPEAARATLHAVLALSVTEFLAVGFAIGSSGHVLGYAFSADKQVVSYVKKMAPFLGMSIVMDGMQAVLSGKLCVDSLEILR